MMEKENNVGTYENDRGRIARNTVFLYFRQMLTMAVGLYTSRVILNALGVDDYGIYNVVGGFVSMFNVISGAFSVAITRFMAYAHGNGGTDRLRKCYSSAMIIQTALGTFICLLLATVGIWYVVNIMVLPRGRTVAALWVLLFSAVSFFISLISIPYNAMIIAHEHMQAFAYIGIAEAVLKLTVAIIVKYSPWDRLILYSSLMVLSAVMVWMLYAAYCRKHFEECHFLGEFDCSLFKEMMAFVSWAFLGNGAVVLKDQGINMIMNLFGGTVVNAARGISQSINNAVQSFTNNFIQAIQPQITQLYASDNRESMLDLVYRSCRYAYYLMLILCLPMIKNIEYVLQIWLGQVPEYVVEFAIFTLMASLVNSIINPLLYGVLATGRIKVYEIVMSITYTSSLPLSYLALKAGYPMISVYYIILVLTATVMFILVWQSACTYELSYRKFAVNVFLRLGTVTLLSGGITYLESVHTAIRFIDFLTESAISVGVTGIMILVFGLEKNERKTLLAFMKRKIPFIN